MPAKAGVSETKLSRFERGNCYYPSIRAVGRSGLADVMQNEGLADALGFESAAARTDFWLANR